MKFILPIMAKFRKFREDVSGSIIIFTLFILVLMLVVTGMAVDFVRFTSAAARLQDTADRAATAATNLNNGLDAEAVVEGYFAAAGFADRLEDVNVTASPSGDFRRVDVTYNYDIDTYFLRLAGRNTIEGTNVSSALQGVANVEVSLVLDISRSMYGAKIEALRPAAASFAETVLDPSNQGVVSLNVIPFGGNIDVGAEMFAFLNGVSYTEGVDPLPTIDLTDPVFDILDTPFAATYEAIEDKSNIPYPDSLNYCIELADYDLSAANLPNQFPMQHSTILGDSGAFDLNASQTCAFGAPVVYAAQVAGDRNIEGTLAHSLLNLPLAYGTSSKMSMNFGLALLDPSSQAAFAQLNLDGVIPDDFADRPAAYDGIGVQKILIFMSDGQPFRYMTPTNPTAPSNLTGSNTTSNTSLVTRPETNPQARAAFSEQCDLAKSVGGSDLLIITVGFETAGNETATTLLEDCASENFFFEADVGNLDSVFNNIASTISQLRVLE